jgi:hypothetical protein
MTLTVQSKDAFGNNRVHGLYDDSRNEFQGEFFKSSFIMRNIKTPEVNSVSSIKVLDSYAGTYNVALRVTFCGTYYLSVFARDKWSSEVSIAGAPFSTQVEPGPAYPPNMVVAGTNLASTVVGVNTSFFVQSYDRYGNQRTSGSDTLTALLTLKTRTKSQTELRVGAQIVNHGSANYTVMYLVTLSAVYVLDIRVDGLHVGAARSVRSPLRLFASAGAIDARMTDVSGAEVFTVDKISQCVLNPRDRFGNFLGNGGSKVELSLCTADDCTARQGQAEIQLSFFNIDTSFFLAVRKRYSGIVKLETAVGAEGSVAVDMVERPDGTFGISFEFRSEGNYSVSILVNRQHIRGSPLTMIAYLEDLSPFPSLCKAKLDETLEWSSDQREAGLAFTGTVATRNRFGVDLSYVDTGLVMGLFVQADVKHELSVMNNLDGTFALKLQITKAGTYNLQVYAKQKASNVFITQVMASPFLLKVVPGRASAATTVALITSNGEYQAGFELSFFLKTRDQFGNDQTGESASRFPYARISTKLTIGDGVRQKFKTLYGDVVNEYNGRYAVSFPSATVAGKYVLIVTDSGFNVERTPMTIMAKAAELSPQSSQLLLSDPCQCTSVISGREIKVQISPRDRYGNARTLADSISRDAITLSVQLLPPAGNSTVALGAADASLIPWRVAHASESDIGGGLLDVFIGGTKKGRYLVHVGFIVKNIVTPVVRSPLVHEVRPSEAVGGMSFIQTTVPTSNIAGKTILIGLQPTDKFGNQHTKTMDESFRQSFQVSIKGFIYLATCDPERPNQQLIQVPGKSCVQVTGRPETAEPGNASVYMANFELSQSGQYKISIALLSLQTGNLETVPGGGSQQPFILMINPAKINASMSVVSPILQAGLVN